MNSRKNIWLCTQWLQHHIKHPCLRSIFRLLQMKMNQRISGSDVSSEDDRDDINGKSTRKPHVPRFYGVRDNRHAEAFWNHESLLLGERAAAQRYSKDVVKHGQGGSREISFKPRSSAKYKEYDDDELPRPDKRRGIESLKLPANGGRGSRGRGGSFRGRGGGFRGRSRGRGN